MQGVDIGGHSEESLGQVTRLDLSTRCVHDRRLAGRALRSDDRAVDHWRLLGVLGSLLALVGSHTIYLG